MKKIILIITLIVSFANADSLLKAKKNKTLLQIYAFDIANKECKNSVGKEENKKIVIICIKNFMIK